MTVSDTAGSVEEQCRGDEEAGADARGAEIIHPALDGLPGDHRQPGCIDRRDPDPRNHAPVIVVATQEQAAVIVVVVAVPEGALEIALGSEDDLVPLPVVTPLAADEETDAVVVAGIAEDIRRCCSSGEGERTRSRRGHAEIRSGGGDRSGIAPHRAAVHADIEALPSQDGRRNVSWRWRLAGREIGGERGAGDCCGGYRGHKKFADHCSYPSLGLSHCSACCAGG